MPTVTFKNRLVFDKNFFDDGKAGRLPISKPAVLTKLMYINDKARKQVRTHNAMSKKTFDQIISENPDYEPAILRCSFYPIDINEIESIPDEIERTIKLAIDLLDEEPYRVLIITSDAKIGEYRRNPHFNGVREIDVKSGKEALAIIDDYFDECRSN